MRSSYIPIIFAIFFILLFSCKKDASPIASIVGKWYVTSQTSKILNNGTLLSSTTKTTFTSDDFAQFFNDGSGYFSERILTSTAIIKFNYTLHNDSLIIYANSTGGGLASTITKLELKNLSIHTEMLIADEQDPEQTDNDIEDFDYRKTY